MRGSGLENRLWKQAVLAVVAAVAVECSVYYTAEKHWAQSESGAVVGSEFGQRTAPSGCDRANPEPEALESGGGTIQGSGLVRRVTGWGEALSVLAGPIWVLSACLSAGWSDLASEVDHRHLPPSMADQKVGQEGQENRAAEETDKSKQR